MADKPLTTPEKSALLALLLHGSEAANPELVQHFGIEIRKAERDGLETRGLITTRKGPRGRVFSQVTEAGWERGRQELTEPFPVRLKPYRLMAGVLRALDAHLARTGQELRAFLQPDEEAEKISQTEAPQTAADLPTRIESAYHTLVGRPGGWVSLTRLRKELDDLGRDELDEALRQLSRDPDAYLVPEANSKILTPEDRAAALQLGGEAKHLLSIERS